VSAKDKLLAFIRYAGEVFGYDELQESDLEIEVSRVEDPDFPFYCTDLAREETDEVFRFCLLENSVPLEEGLEYYFARFRELEEDYSGEFEGGVLLLRPDVTDDEDFWYIYRTESGEVGLFHSVLSIDDDDDEDDDDDDDEDEDDENEEIDSDEDDEEEDEDKTNGRREVGGQ
jgi:hypothetical protein